MNDLIKNFLLWVVVVVVLMVVFQSFLFKSSGVGVQGMIYLQFFDQVDSGNVQKVMLGGDVCGVIIEIFYIICGGQLVIISVLYDCDLINVLCGKGVEIVQEVLLSGILFVFILMNFFLVILIIGFWIFIMCQMQGGGGGVKGVMFFGKFCVKLQGEDQIKVIFVDVVGCDEVKEEVGELVDFLCDLIKFIKLGGKILCGVLMVGLFGIGKILLVCVIVGEVKVLFFLIFGLDFVEMFVGVGVSCVCDMFEQVKKYVLCIIFIDEIDVVGCYCGVGLGGGYDECEQILNQLLVEMDGFEGGEGVIVIVVINCFDVLDLVLLCLGCFDCQVVVGLLDVKGCEQIFKVYMCKLLLVDDVVLMVIVCGMLGFFGVDLVNFCNEVVLFVVCGNEKEVCMDYFDCVCDKILMGVECCLMVMSEEEKMLIVYYEVGYVIVGCLVFEYDLVYKVMIILCG